MSAVGRDEEIHLKGGRTLLSSQYALSRVVVALPDLAVLQTLWIPVSALMQVVDVIVRASARSLNHCRLLVALLLLPVSVKSSSGDLAVERTKAQIMSGILCLNVPRLMLSLQYRSRGSAGGADVNCRTLLSLVAVVESLAQRKDLPWLTRSQLHLLLDVSLCWPSSTGNMTSLDLDGC